MQFLLEAKLDCFFFLVHETFLFYRAKGFLKKISLITLGWIGGVGRLGSSDYE